MQAVKNDRLEAPLNPSNKFIYMGIALVIIFVAAIYINNAYKAFQSPSAQTTVTISQSVLEEKYGLHVNLIAVTGAGGFVDVRLKIVDGEKARKLLDNKKNFPALFSEDGIVLNAPEDAKSQTIKFDDGGNLFIMYPNSGNAVKQGSAVSILFGDAALEPINVR